MARFWGFALMAQAVLALGPARMRDAMRSVVDVVDNGFVEHGLAPRADVSTAKKPLRCFQVANPDMLPKGLVVDDEIIDGPSSDHPSCQVTLMEHVFANSYGRPFVAKYEPPSCAFQKVMLNLTVVSEGRQYDRLAIMWLGDTEVWRTSTAEPKAHPGIVWTAWKDTTNYRSLWRRPQTLIFDLGNLVNEKYTGSFNATLTATFQDGYASSPAARPADRIVPFSALRGSQGLGSAFTYPDERAQLLATLPRNIDRAVVSIAASGQADEEFWWSNVPERGVKAFTNLTLPGLSSFREVRLWIDGHLAGLSWPYPVVFTGGISPPLHRPLVGPQAFDMREQEIDVTPWLGLLCNGREYNFTMEIVGEGDAVVYRYWVLSAKIFLWLDKEGSVTKGSRPVVNITAPDFTPHVDLSLNKYLKYKQTIKRRLRVKSYIRRADNQTVSESWTQKFIMTNDGYLKDGGNFQQVKALYKGEDTAAQHEDTYQYYYAAYAYPISTTYASKAPDGQYSLTIDANLTQGMELVINGPTAFPNGLEPFMHKMPAHMHGTNVKTVRSGHAFFYQLNGGNSSGGFGSTRQTYALGARGLDFNQMTNPDFISDPLLYTRDVSVDNETVTQDRQYVYQSRKGAIDRTAPARLFLPGDQFAPMLIKGRGGSRVFSGEQLAVDHGKVLAPPSPPPPPAKVENPEHEAEDKAMLVPEEPTDENPSGALAKLVNELKKEIKQDDIRKRLEEENGKEKGIRGAGRRQEASKAALDDL
ncbi:Peptide-N4-(N-acetyl-beta-glucosaminyl)asparagine amidase A [Tolypocladium ophioglossoides CBS 100239]|uniref:Peptide-N4-(N-acetyl-beta-glucosaminyl)asparagine amidase A n=1 Tax=Tolypocladium ophioglossoides (strain CBS 100239) TaxID=1163406 RepID=A0A0L0N7D1_TOLOC|nr:Peptide-N4-(N-acetyl-beta-glucosaminyl)asparagine amidase A [Tolypocladium ophioglossoides CBS 100239]